MRYLKIPVKFKNPDAASVYRPEAVPCNASRDFLFINNLRRAARKFPLSRAGNKSQSPKLCYVLTHSRPATAELGFFDGLA